MQITEFFNMQVEYIKRALTHFTPCLVGYSPPQAPQSGTPTKKRIADWCHEPNALSCRGQYLVYIWVLIW